MSRVAIYISSGFIKKVRKRRRLADDDKVKKMRCSINRKAPFQATLSLQTTGLNKLTESEIDYLEG